MNKSAKEVPLAPRLVKTTQAAEYLAISQWKLGNLVQQGLIPYIEDGGGLAHGALMFVTSMPILSVVGGFCES